MMQQIILEITRNLNKFGEHNMSIENLIKSREDKLFFYSPYNFIREIPLNIQVNQIVVPQLLDTNLLTYEDTINNKKIIILYSKLEWDSAYFNINTFKIINVLFDEVVVEDLSIILTNFIRNSLPNDAYLFLELPSEDIKLFQALGLSRFKLVETRLTYFRGNLASFNEPRYPVRLASESDSNNLKNVAREMRNDYDRFHADSIFRTEIADEFLATYIEQSLKGFADAVLTSNEDGIPSDCFLTAKYFKSDWSKLNKNVSKMVLSAVSNKTNKGWYKKLISEMTYHLREQGAEYIFMNTQSTNRAVFYTWEKLGYQLGSTTHVFSYTKKL